MGETFLILSIKIRIVRRYYTYGVIIKQTDRCHIQYYHIIQNGIFVACTIIILKQCF